LASPHFRLSARGSNSPVLRIAPRHEWSTASSGRFCIDGTPLLVRSAGVKTYLYHWLGSLRAIDPENILTFLGSTDEKLDHYGRPWRHSWRLATLWAMNRTGGVLINVAAPQCDVFHISICFTIRPPSQALRHDSRFDFLDRSSAPYIQRRKGGQRFRSPHPRPRGRINRRLGEHAAGRDPDTGNSSDKIRVIHLGVPATYFSARASAHPGKPYLLFVGTIEPRKNLDSLLAAWASLPSDFRREYQLLIAA